jgi:hypothetical protein
LSIQINALYIANKIMGAALSTRRILACPDRKGHGNGICVSAKHGVAVLPFTFTQQLRIYSLINGTLIDRTVKQQLINNSIGLCVSSDGDSVLVVERCNGRVQEVRITDGSWVRFVGEGVLKCPHNVDCNGDVIVVSELNPSISVLSWVDGSMRARFGSYGSGPGQLKYPQGVRLLADGSGVVVADSWNDRLCVFALSGELVAAVGSRDQGLNFPHDVLECALDGNFIVANTHGYNLMKLGRDGVKVEMYGRYGGGNGQFIDPNALAALPNDGCLVVDSGNQRVQHLAHLRARLAWMRACACRIV